MLLALRSCLVRIGIATLLCAGIAFPAVNPHYVITDDDVTPPLPTTATFYTVGSGGALTLGKDVNTDGNGIAGGFFGTQRVGVLQSGKQQCVFVSMAQSGDIAAIPVGTLKPLRPARGSKNDNGTLGGIGIAVNAKYLYAGFTTSNTIGTFQVQSGCKLKFLGDTHVMPLNGGNIDGMALHGSMMVVTYGDGSIESFDISEGVPVSNGDEQDSTGFKGANWPNGVDITKDGHYAIFGDTATSTIVEVSDISSGKLDKTTVYDLGRDLSASNVLLSPDETLLYIANTQGGTVTAARFDITTGVVSKGCVSKKLRGFATGWAYLGSLVTEQTSGSGTVVYVAEYGAPSSIGMVEVKSDADTCKLTEAPKSPVSDPNSQGLLSIGIYPPRPF